MFTKERVGACQDANHKNDKRRVRCAGVVLVRQRPGSAKGVVFMTLEDETGIANIVVWPKVMEQYRKEVMGARLILVEGYIQSSPEQVTHLVAQRMFDRSHDLIGLANDTPSRRHPVPAGPALVEPLNDDRRAPPDTPAQKMRHHPARADVAQALAGRQPLVAIGISGPPAVQVHRDVDRHQKRQKARNACDGYGQDHTNRTMEFRKQAAKTDTDGEEGNRP